MENIKAMKAIEHKEETILQELSRIRKQMAEEEVKDPKKYQENMLKKKEKLKAEGFKFITKPLILPKAKHESM